MPYVISDSFAKTVEQPDEFEVYVDGSQTPIKSAIATDAAGLEYFKFDLNTLPAGKHTLIVRSKNEWGESVDSAPFIFAKGVPSPPTNLRYSDT